MADKRRILRGGSWWEYYRNCRLAYRDTIYPDCRYYYYGFRTVRVPVTSPVGRTNEDEIKKEKGE